MLISFEKKFIFIHIPKTGGSSIKNRLKKNNGFLLRHKERFLIKFLPDLIKKSLFPIQNRLIPLFPHPTANNIQKELSKQIYNNYYKFGFIRNPWDWLLSYYLYMKSFKPENSPYKLTHRQIKVLNIIEEVKKISSFEEFIKWVAYKHKDFETNLFIPQKHFFTDEEGNIIVDYIGKFENLNEDFNYIVQHLGLKNTSLPHKNRTKHKNYREYYNDYTRKLVEEHFKEDIELFNYEF